MTSQDGVARIFIDPGRMVGWMWIDGMIVVQSSTSAIFGVAKRSWSVSVPGTRLGALVGPTGTGMTV